MSPNKSAGLRGKIVMRKGGGIYDTEGNAILSFDEDMTIVDLTTTGDTILGDASTDTLTINATSQVNAPITIGVNDTGYDFKAFGATAGAHLLWDESADSLLLVGGAKINAQGTVTVGVDDTGYDVKFFGATASAYLLWDESADNLVLAGTAGLSCTSPTGSGIGYGTGAGGAVTQATNRTTGVTLNTLAGTITTDNTSLAAEGTADFVVTNSTVAIGDTIVLSIQSGSNSGGTVVCVAIVTDGTFTIRVHNGNVASGTAETGAILINFAVIKAVSA